MAGCGVVVGKPVNPTKCGGLRVAACVGNRHDNNTNSRQSYYSVAATVA